MESRRALGSEQLGSELQCHTYPMLIEPTITRVSSGISGYMWLDTEIASREITQNIFLGINSITCKFLIEIEVSLGIN